MVNNVLNKEMFYSTPLCAIINGIGLGLHATCGNLQVCAVTVATHVSDCASADIQVVLIFDHCNKAVTCGSQHDHIHYQ